MMKSGSRHLHHLLLAGTAIASPVAAQEVELPMPPVRQAVDQNGVNLATGLVEVADPQITIGANQGLSFRRFAPGSSGVWSHQYTYGIYGPAGDDVTAIVDNRSIEFDFVGGAYVNKAASGETLTNTGSGWVLTLRDGTIVELDLAGLPAGDDYYYIWGGVSGVAKRITYPDKHRLTFFYQALTSATGGSARVTARLQSVLSSYGYLLKLQYAENGSPTNWYGRLIKATLVNQAVDYCDPAANSCTGLTRPWPTLDYSYQTDIGPPITSIDKVTDSLGRTTRYALSGRNVKAIRRPALTSASVNASIEYGAGNRVSSITSDGRTWTYAWSVASPLMTATITNPDQTQKVIVTDTVTNQVKSERDELNRTTQYEHDAQGRVTFITYPEGNKLKFTYDGRGNVTEQRAISKTPGSPPDIVISATYAASCTNAITCNLPVNATDARGQVTDLTYDPVHGGLLTATAPVAPSGVRPQTRYSYVARQAYFKNSAGSIVASGQTTYLPAGTSACQTLASCVGTADEVKTTVDYGPQTAGTANNLLPVTTSKGSGDNLLTATRASSYDAIGNLTHVDGPLAGSADTTRIIYDAARQVAGQIGPDPDGSGPLPNRATRNSYNGDGQLVRIERGTTAGQSDTNWANFAASETIDLKFDPMGRLIEQKLSGSAGAAAITQTSYDLVGRPECSAVRMNPLVFGSLPASACALSTPGAHGPDQITRSTYDEAGQLIGQVSGFGTANQAVLRTMTYTANGKLRTLKDGEFNLTTYDYDGQDRPIKTSFPSLGKGSQTSSSADYELLTYENTASGARTSATLASRRLRDGQLIGFSYDNLGRLLTRDLPGSEPDVSYSYDNLNRARTVSRPGHTLTFGYDALGRQTSDGQAWGTITRSYDLAGRLTRTAWWDGFFVDYDRLVTGEISKVRENGASSGIGVLAEYGYDSLGRRTSIARGNGTGTSYAYDPVSKLASVSQDLSGTVNDVTFGTMSYSPSGQVIAQPRSNDAYAWNAAAITNRNYVVNGLNQYTQSGAIVPTYDQRGNLTSAGSTVFTYTAENRLATATGGISIQYDPIGRISEYNAAASIRFINDGSAIAAEIENPSGIILRRYVRGDGPDEVLVWYEGAGQSDRRWLHSDERGSIVALSDGIGGLVKANNYDEFGIPGTGNVGRFQYTGQAWFQELGMYHYKARIYSPSLGRFLQTDPVGYDDGMNLYAYVTNDPVNFTDPLGDRRLTNGERQLLYGVFGYGSAVHPETWRLNLNHGDMLPSRSAVTWGENTVGISTDLYSEDYSKTAVSAQVEVFWHEVYHAFEIRLGIVGWSDLAWNQVRSGFSRELYKYDPSKGFMEQNPEARAEYFGNCMAGGDCSALSGFKVQLDAFRYVAWNSAAGMFVTYHIPTGTRLPVRMH